MFLTGKIGLSSNEKQLQNFTLWRGRVVRRGERGFSLEMNTLGGLWVAIILGTREYTLQ
jgi:hypothetical protein